jgi:NAD(P)-dependent dehydrogenase (short-subunit alcohol dehydrogenase family)
VKNKKVFILGASSDIGVTTVNYFLDNNWSVIAHYNKNKKELKKIKSDKLEYFKFDLKNISSFENLIKSSKILNLVDSFVSLTGYVESKNILKTDIKSFYHHINVNYLSNLIIIKKILPLMNNRKFGRVLLSSSVGVKFGGGKSTGLYSLSKYMNEFFFSNYKEFYRKNILINALRIGVTKTKIHKNVKNKNLKKRVSLIPIGRMASTNEVAKYIYFYSSDLNSLTTNKIVDISGGE